MHYHRPKAVGMTGFNSYTAYSTRPMSERNWLCTWLCRDRDLVDSNPTSFFVEHRRKTFSDVAHAKVVSWDTTYPTDITPTWRWYFESLRWKHLYSGSGFEIWDATSGIGEPSTSVVATFSDGSFSYGFFVSCNYARLEGKTSLSCGKAYLCYKTGESGSRITYNYTDAIGSISYANSTGEITSLTHSGDYDLSSALRGASVPYGSDMPKPSVVRGAALSFLYTLQDIFVKSIYNHREDYSLWHSTWTNIESVQEVSAHIDSTMFLLDEPEVYVNKNVFITGDFKGYWRNVLTQQSYLDAINKVPRLNDNSISNIIEICSFIYNLVVLHKIEIPKSLSDLWLAYRYQYTTTKLDAEEAISFVDRHLKLGDWKSIKCYGSHSITYKGVEITCRTSLRVKPKTLNTVQSIWRALTKYGLSPSFYIVWDMIPYSFLVDWFIPIGSIADALDAEHTFKAQYDVLDINQSISYELIESIGQIRCYTRWLSSTPPELCGYYFLENSRPSNKVLGMRILDAASLILG